MSKAELIAYLESYLTERRKRRLHEVLAMRTRHFTVATEDVYHLHNTSAIMRSCEVFGIQDLHSIGQTSESAPEREIAMGSEKWVDVYHHESVEAFCKSMKDKGYQIIVTDPHADDSDLTDFPIQQKSCFVFGKETDGISDQLMAKADGALKIPMVGFTESLNVSVSAAIVLQLLTHRLRRSDIPWQLSELESRELLLDWLCKSIKSADQIIAHYEQNGDR